MEEKKDKLRLPCIEDSDAPWLMYTHGFSNRKQVQTFCNISGTSNTTSHLKSIPQLRHKSIVASIHGWLILRQFDIFSIFNPLTLYTVVLPPLLGLDNDNDNIKCGLKSTPDCHDCVLLVCLTKANIMFSCRPAEPNCCWIAHPFQLQDSDSDSSVAEIVTVNGVMYVFTSDRLPEKLLYRVDHDSTSLILKPFKTHGPDSLPILNLAKHYIVESCNQIYLVLVGSYYVEQLELEYIKVLELDIDECLWRDSDSLGGRSFFLGHDCSSTWCWGTTEDSGSQGGIQRNCIYFYHSYAPPHFVHIYNLHYGLLLPLRPCPDLLNPKSKYPVWVIPQHLRLEKLELEQEQEQEQGIKEVVKIKHQGVKEISQQESRLSSLPPDMLNKISKHMNLFEYWNFRATSTIFHSICPAPQWKTNNEVPLFLFFNNARSCKLIDPSQGLLLSHVPLFEDYFLIRYTKNGWVLAVVGMSLQYINIFTGARGEYPIPPSMEDLYYYFNTVAFSTYPTSSECLTIGTFRSEDVSVIFYHESGKDIWKDYVLEYEDDISFDFSNCCPVFLGGAFYILDSQGNLGVFQLVNGEPSWRMFAKPQTLNKFYASHLLDSQGVLYSVFLEKMGQWVQVFRFDNLIKCWVEVESLGNQVFFISRASSFSIVTKQHKMRNRIYLPRLYKKGLLCYSQDTNNYHSSTSDEIIKDFYGTYEPLRCCWI